MASDYTVTSDWGTTSTAIPMELYNGMVIRKPNRNAPTADYDLTPHQMRQFVDASGAQQVQIHNGMRWRTLTGVRLNYPGSSPYLYAVMPKIPGQTRGQVGGFHKRGPSPLNVQAMYEAGPGSQPDNPGGPGKIAAPVFINPMSG